jgi:hypothetical protein
VIEKLAEHRAVGQSGQGIVGSHIVDLLL